MSVFNLPIKNEQIKLIPYKEVIRINGKILVFRDSVHKILQEYSVKNKKLPVDLKNKIIFYAGPAPTPPNNIIGSIGPTTSIRMDKYVPFLIKYGIQGFIGKGDRNATTEKIIKKNNLIYFVTFGGCAALLSSFVIKSEILAFKEFGAEALFQLTVENFPVIRKI